MAGTPKHLVTWGERALGLGILILCLYFPAIVYGKWVGSHAVSMRYSFRRLIYGPYHPLTDSQGEISFLLDPDSWVHWLLVPPWMLVFLPWFLLLLFGWALARGRKRTILYLRRFGSTSANQVINRAMEGQLRSRYRVITLDDSAFMPQYATPAMTWTFASIASVLILLNFSIPIFAIIWKFVSLLPRNAGMRSIRDITESILSLGAPILTGVLWWTWFGVAALLILGWRRRRNARVQIQRPDDIRRCARRIHQLSGWLRASRLTAPAATVVTTADEVWQPAVLTFAEHTQVLVFDISVLSPSVMWEIEQLISRSYTHVVYVAHEDQLKDWTENVAHQGTTEKIKAKLSAATILRYRDQMPPVERRRFYCMLKEQVNRVARSRHEVAPNPKREIRSYVYSALRWALAYVVICALATGAVASVVLTMQWVFDKLDL